MTLRHVSVVALLAAVLAGVVSLRAERLSSDGQVRASSSAEGFTPSGARDSNRFSASPGHAWQAATGVGPCWWQVEFRQPRVVGAILQITGDHPFVLRSAPLEYVWQWSLDGQSWHDFSSTRTARERRLFRLFRLDHPQPLTHLRLQIASSLGPPVLREVELYSDRAEPVPFPDWVTVVNTTDQPALPGAGEEFIPLARSCPGWTEIEAQQVWLGDFDESLIEAEPRPLGALLSGNFKDWCQIRRESWRGTQEILRRGRLPMWASCGGAQGLAILADAGVDRAWDCPHCRDPLAPKTPIYTHIGHTAARPCGDYSGCVFERGPHWVEQVGQDAVFMGLPRAFTVMESHCGQIEWPPTGWERIATAGAGTQTKNQCLRLVGKCVYAAQFHIEMSGTPDVSRRIMGNFLSLAKQWRDQQIDGGTSGE
ncbi:MAG: hypothetical protein U1G07_21755 [Verrucomicrobiota bacterium]